MGTFLYVRVNVFNLTEEFFPFEITISFNKVFVDPMSEEMGPGITWQTGSAGSGDFTLFLETVSKHRIFS